MLSLVLVVHLSDKLYCVVANVETDNQTVYMSMSVFMIYTAVCSGRTEMGPLGSVAGFGKKKE